MKMKRLTTLAVSTATKKRLSLVKWLRWSRTMRWAKLPHLEYESSFGELGVRPCGHVSW